MRERRSELGRAAAGETTRAPFRVAANARVIPSTHGQPVLHTGLQRDLVSVRREWHAGCGTNEGKLGFV